MKRILLAIPKEDENTGKTICSCATSFQQHLWSFQQLQRMVMEWCFSLQHQCNTPENQEMVGLSAYRKWGLGKIWRKMVCPKQWSGQGRCENHTGLFHTVTNMAEEDDMEEDERRFSIPVGLEYSNLVTVCFKVKSVFRLDSRLGVQGKNRPYPMDVPRTLERTNWKRVMSTYVMLGTDWKSYGCN